MDSVCLRWRGRADPALQEREIELTNVKGIFGQLIAEYVLGYTIQHYRHFKDYKTLQAEKRWSPKPYQSITENAC